MVCLLVGWLCVCVVCSHAESAGNVDDAVYGKIPDNQIPLSERGKEQARSAGVTLKRLIGNETTDFFVSPYARCVPSLPIRSVSLRTKALKLRCPPPVPVRSCTALRVSIDLLICRCAERVRRTAK
jgi:hypothetical protein